MAEDHDRTEAQLSALLQAGAHKRGTNALSLMRRRDCHRCEAHNPQFRVSSQQYG